MLQEHIPVCILKTVLQSLLGFSRTHVDAPSAGGLLFDCWLIQDALGCGLIHQKGVKSSGATYFLYITIQQSQDLIFPLFCIQLCEVDKGF